MLQKLTWGRCTAEDRRAFVAEAERMVKEYGWEKMHVYPYGYPVKVTKIINEFKWDYDRCTRDSKQILILTVNGLADILNHWEEDELAPKRKVRVLDDGAVLELNEDMAKLIVEAGKAEYI